MYHSHNLQNSVDYVKNTNLHNKRTYSKKTGMIPESKPSFLGRQN